LGYSAAVAAIIAASPTIFDTPNIFDTPPNGGSHTVSSDDFSSSQLVLVTWFGAQAFVGYLNSIDYAGSNQWALPSAGANPQIGFNPTGSQSGRLFYDELGGTAGNPIPNNAQRSPDNIERGIDAKKNEFLDPS
jgi:hypothetical protein